MLTTYIYANWITPQESMAEVMTTLLIPLAITIFGILLAMIRHQLTIRRDVPGVRQVTTVGPFPTSVKDLPPDEFQSIEIATIVQDPTSPEFDLYQISLRPKKSTHATVLWIGSESQEAKTLARQIAEMIELPIVETDNLREREEAD